MAMADEGSLTRFANSEIHQNVAETNVQVNLRFVDRQAGRRRVDEPLRRRGPPAPRRDGPPRSPATPRSSRTGAACRSPTPIRDVPEGYAEATAGATPELRAEGVRAVIAAADAAGVVAYGSFSTATETLGIANSKGVRASQRRTVSQLLTVAMAPDGGSGYAESAAVDVDRDRRRGDRPRGGREGAGDRQPGRRRPGRLAGRPRGVRGRRPALDARLHGLQRARGPGGAVVRRARHGASAATSSSIVDDGHGPGRRCRWPSTTRASRRSASR